jgi:hypothetical protein
MAVLVVALPWIIIGYLSWIWSMASHELCAPRLVLCNVPAFGVGTLCRLVKQNKGFGYVESGEIKEVTSSIQNCDQTQWKGLSFKSDISANVDVFNRRFVTQFLKVALDYVVDLSRYCTTRKFYSDLRCPEIFLIVVKIHMLYVGPKFTYFRFPCWDTSLSE